MGRHLYNSWVELLEPTSLSTIENSICTKTPTTPQRRMGNLIFQCIPPSVLGVLTSSLCEHYSRRLYTSQGFLRYVQHKAVPTCTVRAVQRFPTQKRSRSTILEFHPRLHKHLIRLRSRRPPVSVPAASVSSEAGQASPCVCAHHFGDILHE